MPTQGALRALDVPESGTSLPTRVHNAILEANWFNIEQDYIDSRQHHKSTSADKQAVDQTDCFLEPVSVLGRHPWFPTESTRDVVPALPARSGIRHYGKPSFTFRLALPCVTFHDAGLKLTSSAPSLRYHAAGGRLAHERARIIQREQPEIHLHLHPSRNLGTMGCIGPLPTLPVLISTSLFRHSLTLARRPPVSSLRRREVEKRTDGGMMMSGIGRGRVIDRMPHRGRKEEMQGNYYIPCRTRNEGDLHTKQKAGRMKLTRGGG
ncbi:hypothetical protein G5I_00747 [Acromyrmex echinatior]|uniref:Uncharacterized protein n=1 Tax=Acromyrmex echinatior TaxID=103372 RepID=F4W5P9_ACREC|nr:hypothetical protein G5I_00747 [Acromyrmex echinatior]